MWRRIDDNQQICNDCYEKNRNNLKEELESANTAFVAKTDEKKTTTRLRKSTRSTRYKAKSGSIAATVQNGPTANNTNGSQPKPATQKGGGRGRRNLQRRAPMKAPTMTATTSFVKSLFYKVNEHP